MASVRHWKNEYTYQRILEILEDYWITEPEEKEVVVDMHFLNANGETQDKHLVWRNPKYMKSPDAISETTVDLFEGERMMHPPIRQSIGAVMR